MDKQTGRTGQVGTAHTLIDILEVLEEFGGAGVTEIAHELDIAPSTVHRHLSTLYDREYAIKEGDRYHISTRFLKLGQECQNRHKIYQMSEKIVEELAEETEERAQFLIEEHDNAVYLHIARGQHSVNTTPGLARAIPLHVGSSGKTLLAFGHENRIEEYIERTTFERFTEHTVTNPDELREELAEIKERGYAYNDQEFIKGLRSVSVPVRSVDERVIGALTIAGPTQRMKGDRYHEDLPDLLLGTANELELNAHYDQSIP